MRIFHRMALYLYKRACIWNLPLFTNRQVEKDLEKLYPGEQKVMCTKYYVQKIAKSLLICFVGAFLGIVISAQSGSESLFADDGVIVRGSYEDGTKEVTILCELPEGNQSFSVAVGAKVFDEEEIEAIYKSFSETLPELILGGNASLMEISENLCLQESYEGYPFTVEWESSNTDSIHNDGTIDREVQEEDVELNATITYEERQWQEVFPVQVMALDLTEEERIHRELEQLLIASEEESRTSEEWRLPDSWQGQKLRWFQKTENRGPVLWAGSVVVALLVYMLADKDLHDEVMKRQQQMKKDYADLVHKLVLYLGAGMTIRGSFQRMAEEYERGCEEGKVKRPIYEELVHTCRELKSGVSEGAAYEHFGRRTGLQEYIRLSTLLTQNLKKGNSLLLQRLREEADKASLERLQYSKRLGEEAVTKLLLPMVMMLLVVMLMIMIPAFSSVGT